eukprot:jgi/Astpho2/8160/e_gw1.00120.231.1_t
MLLDFGLKVLHGDMTTDGRWCFLIFKAGPSAWCLPCVVLCPGIPAHWALLKARLEKICPSGQAATSLWRWTSDRVEVQHPFLLQVTSYDRAGVLHDLMHTLWESNVAVFKAHITTGPSNKVLDLFWLYDNKGKAAPPSGSLAPCSHCQQRARRVWGARGCAGGQECRRVHLPALFCAGCARWSRVPEWCALGREPERCPNGIRSPLQITIDNSTTAAYSLVGIVCLDRKGLAFDLMRTLKDMNVRVAFGSINTRARSCEADLFVQEPACRDSQQELKDRIRQAVALPVRIAIKDVYDETCTELLVTANLDSGGRGRPRVTYDVTAALNAMHL